MTPEQLKVSILQYAMQGKLVAQRLEEGTAEELYRQIQEKKTELIKAKKIKSEKTIVSLTDDEIPFDIPESWKWCRLSEVIDVRDGTHDSPKYVPEGIPLVTSKNLSNGTIDYGNIKFITQTDADKINERSAVDNDDILFAMIGSIGNPVLVKKDREFCIKNMALFKKYRDTSIDMNYMYWFFFFVQYSLKAEASGGVQSFISLSRFREYPIPLPPFKEQQRIAARIEELLPYVDNYAKAHEKLKRLSAKFPEDMKKSILQYAIQGKLVEQRPEEGTAEELYQQIQEEKQHLIKEGKIKKEKPLAEITEDEIPFDIPESWKWVKLGDCTTYAQTKEKITPKDIENDMWSLDLEDIQKETGNILVKTKASERKISGDKVRFHKNQVLYSKLRPYLKKILVAPDDGICTPELVPFNTYLIDEEYLVSVLKSPHVDYVINAVTYGVKMPRVGTDTMINLLIPLPPLAEQKRIVSKIKELMPYCDQLVN